MTRASWSADRVGTDVKVAFHNLDGHPVSLLLFDPDGRRVAQIPIAGSGIWGPESCVAQIDSKGQGVGMIGETTMTSSQFSAFESRWRAYTVRTWGDPGSPANAGAVIALEDSGCRAIRQTTP